MTFAVAVSAAMLAAVSAQAQQGGTQEERDACTPDVYKFCEAAIPDEKQIVSCLRKNVKRLTPACAKVIAADNK